MPGGRPRDPAYWAKYRASHPEYRERQRVLRRARRARMTPQERRRERGQSKPVLPPAELPALHVGHDLFDHAKRIAKIHHGYKYLTHPFYDDLVCEIVLALVEGRSPLEARSAFLEREYRWRKYAVQVHDGYEPYEGSLINQGPRNP